MNCERASATNPSNRRRRRLTLLVAAVLTAICGSAHGQDEKNEQRFVLSVYQLWASPGEAKEKPPAWLAKRKTLLRELTKRTKMRRFRLAAKPTVKTVQFDEALAVRLPSGYSGRWTVTQAAQKKGRATTAVRQQLTNPKKKTSTLRLPQTPGITQISRIKGEGDFLVVVDLQPYVPKKKSD